MSIERTGDHWKGTVANDIDEYLVAFAAAGYPVERTAHSRCSQCQGSTFTLRVDDEEGYADRRCLACGNLAFILDSQQYADDSSPEECACPCGGEAFELAIGFAMVDVEALDSAMPASDPDARVLSREVKWVSIGARCVRDGTLGVYADWKIDYAPTAHMLGQA